MRFKYHVCAGCERARAPVDQVFGLALSNFICDGSFTLERNKQNKKILQRIIHSKLQQRDPILAEYGTRIIFSMQTKHFCLLFRFATSWVEIVDRDEVNTSNEKKAITLMSNRLSLSTMKLTVQIEFRILIRVHSIQYL